ASSFRCVPFIHYLCFISVFFSLYSADFALRSFPTRRSSDLDEFVLVERPSPEWSIGRMNEVLYHQKDNIGLLENLRDSVFTPSSWVETINRLLKGEEIDDTKRHYGPNI